MYEPRTWHHGLIARWWAEFNVAGPQIAYFRQFIARYGEPVLDAGCGTGRLLLPWLRDGVDVDGCDVSEDMLALCRASAEKEGLAPRLYRQALHELDLPRRYRTIVVSGVLGIGGDRAWDQQALVRFHRHLKPAGALVLDNEVPYASARRWPYWLAENQKQLPEPWPEGLPPAPGTRRRAADGTDYAQKARLVELDPLAQRCVMEMRTWRWRGDELLAQEDYTIEICLYFAEELRLMVERAGFGQVEMYGAYRLDPPTPTDGTVVLVATK